VFETIPLLAVIGWLVTRTVPSEPDRASAAAWHLIPFLLGWYGMRAWKKVRTSDRTDAAPATEAGSDFGPDTPDRA
jgi:hypothetical protein